MPHSRCHSGGRRASTEGSRVGEKRSEPGTLGLKPSGKKPRRSATAAKAPASSPRTAGSTGEPSEAPMSAGGSATAVVAAGVTVGHPHVASGDALLQVKSTRTRNMVSI